MKGRPLRRSQQHHELCFCTDGEPVGWDENAIGAFVGREFSSAANAKMMYLSFEYIFLLVQKRMHVDRTPHMTCRDGQNERH